MPIDELHRLADTLGRISAAAASADWDDDADLARAAAAARAELAAVADGDIVAASPPALAVRRARVAVAEAVIAVAESRHLAAQEYGAPARTAVAANVGHHLRVIAGRVGTEVRHLIADRPRAILARILVTLAIALSLVSFYHVTGLTRYDDAGRLTLYLFSAVVGSVICTNALCFEAERVRAMLSGGEPLWRILVTKNLAMAVMITAAGLPVVGLLTATGHVNPAAMVDQLVTMVFIWLGVGNILSVVNPLRHEPVSARLRDGTWKPFLLSFAVSYGVGLTVNLMIYWRLWARYKASAELAGGAWAAFTMVLASAVLSWILLTVLAVACGREPRIRRLLSREMVVYRKPEHASGSLR